MNGKPTIFGKESYFEESNKVYRSTCNGETGLSFSSVRVTLAVAPDASLFDFSVTEKNQTIQIAKIYKI